MKGSSRPENFCWESSESRLGDGGSGVTSSKLEVSSTPFTVGMNGGTAVRGEGG